MTEGPDPAPAADETIVPMLRLVACPKCRRARGAALAGARGPQPGRGGNGYCPHGKPDKTVWADGYGPGSEPPDESAWETQPDGPV